MTSDQLTELKIFAHRGFSSRHPEMTLAAYREAIAWAVERDIEIGLECDVQFSADDELICLHDLLLDRTSDTTGPAYQRTVDELRKIDFGSWTVPNPAPEQRSLVTLAELFALVAKARAAGARINLAVETKHPNPRGLAIEDRVAEMVSDAGWAGPGSPVRVISFSVEAVRRAGELLPDLERALLIEVDLGQWVSGELPYGVRIVGPDLELVRADPDFVARARSCGNEVHVWTVNKVADIELCLELGVTGFTTDYPDRVAQVLGI